MLVIIFLLSFYTASAQSIAEWHTTLGEFQVMLREDLMPITTNNFISLTNSNFYDGLIFHRVVVDFVIQDGDPTGTGTGGPGYTIPDEYHPEMLFEEEGVLGMAKTSQPNSAGSQYFITLAPTPWLNGNYAAFGNVIAGMDVVQTIGDVPTNGPNGNPPYYPDDPVYIDSIRIVTPQLFGITPEEDSLSAAVGEMLMFAVLSNDPGLTYSWYVNEVLQAETGFILFYTFPAAGSYVVRSIVSNGAYEYPTCWYVEVGGTASENSNLSSLPFLLQNSPNPFNPVTTISFAYTPDLPENPAIQIYNLQGRQVKILPVTPSPRFSGSNEGSPAGSIMHSVIWDGTDDKGQPVTSGIYFYRLNIRNSPTGKMILLK